MERCREPYCPHSGKFIVDIGDGTDEHKYDYVLISPNDDVSVVLVKHMTSIVAFDGTRFMEGDFTHPLNHKRLRTDDEAYAKFMRWIGKMVKKDARSRYYTDTTHVDYQFSEGEFEACELMRISKKLKED